MSQIFKMISGMLYLEGFINIEGGSIMPRSNDSDNNVNRLKKTISNMEAAEAAMEFADGRELAAIKAKNERRKDNIEELQDEITAENKSRINGYLWENDK